MKNSSKNKNKKKNLQVLTLLMGLAPLQLCKGYTFMATFLEDSLSVRFHFFRDSLD